jgi:F420H(2)-dependent quinone reductase
MARSEREFGVERHPPLVPRALNKLWAPRSAPMPVLRFHQWIYVISDGRIGPGIIGSWTLLLRTVGRRSGQPRLNALAFIRDGERFIVVASNSGKDQEPGWFHNLRDNSDVDIQVGREHIAACATVIESTNAEYPRLWDRMNGSVNGRYDVYQSKTSRPIPIVSMERTPHSPSV